MSNARLFSDPLTDLRSQIDTCDDALLSLLKKRMRIVTDVAHLKNQQGADKFIRPAREAQILRRLLAESAPLPPDFVIAVWRTLMMGALQLEQPFRFGYVGSVGLVLGIQLFGTLTPYQSYTNYSDLIRGYKGGEIDHLVLPLEDAELWMADLNALSGSILFHLPLMATSAVAMQGIVWGDTTPEASGQDFCWYYTSSPALDIPDAVVMVKTSHGTLWASEEEIDLTETIFWGYTGLLG